MKILFNNKPKARGASSKQRPKPSRTFTFDGKKLLPLLLVSVLTLVAVGIGQAVFALVERPVSRVAVNGEFVNAQRQQLVKDVEVFLGSGFLLLDLGGIREQLIQQPWVFDVMVERQWPDEIAITVIEQKAIARWGQNAYLNHRGEVFRPTNPAANSASLPQLAGPDASEQQVMNHFRELSGSLASQGLVLEELLLSESGNWSLVLENGIAISLGDSEVMEKIRRLLATYNQGLSADFAQIKTIDMRYSNGFAVGWRGEKS